MGIQEQGALCKFGINRREVLDLQSTYILEFVLKNHFMSSLLYPYFIKEEIEPLSFRSLLVGFL